MNDTGKRFVRDTWYDRVSEPDQARGLPQPPLETPEEGERITLPTPDVITVPPLDLRAAIEQRRSLRKYADNSLSLEELAYLLWTTQGVREVIERPTVRVTFRTVPSAGARHAFDTYVLANRVEGLEPGLYRYMAVEHALVRLPRPASIAADLTEACLGQAFVGTCAATFFGLRTFIAWVGVMLSAATATSTSMPGMCARTSISPPSRLVADAAP